MDIIAILMGNPALQAALIGTGVKLAVDQLKKLFVKVDESGVPDQYKVPVQLLVIICSGLAAMGDLAMKGQLSSYDPSTLVNFVATVLPVYISAFIAHKGGRVVLEKTLGRETVLRKG